MKNSKIFITNLKPPVRGTITPMIKLFQAEAVNRPAKVMPVIKEVGLRLFITSGQSIFSARLEAIYNIRLSHDLKIYYYKFLRKNSNKKITRPTKSTTDQGRGIAGLKVFYFWVKYHTYSLG